MRDRTAQRYRRLVNVNWLSDVAVPLGVLAISTLFTLSLARANRRERIAERNFERNQRFADDFLAVALAHEKTLLGSAPYDARRRALDEMHVAWMRWADFTLGPNEYPVHAYLALQWEHIAQGDLAATNEEAQRVATAFSSMQALVRGWVFPEERGGLLESRVYPELIGLVGPEAASARLQIDRWRLTGNPARTAAGRWWRKTNVGVRSHIEDRKARR